MAAVSVAPATNGTVYWTGQDGNIYVKGVPGQNGVQNYGSSADWNAVHGGLAPTSAGASNPYAKSVGEGSGILLASQIADPNAPKTPTPTTTTAPATNALSSTTINDILQTIADAVTKNQNAYNSAAAYNKTQDANDLAQYSHQVQTNNQSRSSAIQDAEQAAASGSQGLRGVLASLGALDGTGSELAGRAVADSANNDIGTADKTYQANADAIQNAQTAYKNTAAKRDADLSSALNADNQNAKASGIQEILNAASNVGDTGTYQKFLPQLVQASAPPVQLTGTQTVYNPASVNSFAPPSGLTVSSAPSTNSAAAQASTTPINSALYVKKQS